MMRDWNDSKTSEYGKLRSDGFYPKETTQLQPADLIAGVVQRCVLSIARSPAPAESAGSPFLPTGPYCDGCEPATRAHFKKEAGSSGTFSVYYSTEKAVYPLTVNAE
jgi:hypothetical protein